MHAVGVVPLHVPDRGASKLAPVVVDAPPLQVSPGRLMAVEKASLGSTQFVLAEDQMARVEDALCEVLALSDLCQPMPRRPPPPTGPVTYPRWGEIYYIAGQRFANEHKRYVVVSNDHWNRADGTAVAVRTTTQDRRSGTAFPPLQGGAAKACCGDATAFAARRFDLRQRPQLRWLPTADMVAIAWGLVETHQLHAAVRRVQDRSGA